MKTYSIELNDYTNNFIELMAKHINTTPERLIQNFITNHFISLERSVRNKFFLSEDTL